MTAIVSLISAARRAGIEFRLVGSRVQFRPTPPPPEAAPVIEQLRQHRAELAVALAASTPGWREGAVCPACLALRWADRDGQPQCDCRRPAAHAATAAPSPMDHPAGCTCGWCWAWRQRQPFHAQIAPGSTRQVFPRDWTPCSCGGGHRPCGMTGRCSLVCPCGLCMGWRRAMGYSDNGGAQ